MDKSYPINIGNGGAGGLSNAQGTTGESSTAFSVTANGGIGGGGWYSSQPVEMVEAVVQVELMAH